MSILVMALDNANYIAAMFLEAAHIIKFQHRWMSADMGQANQELV